MKVVAVIGQKGGCGKTTVSLGLASVAAKVGLAVAVIDLDPQATAACWADRREDKTIAVVSAPSRLNATLENAKAGEADLVIIDTAGKSDTQAADAARAADLVLMPVRPHIFDLETLRASIDILRLAGNPRAAVLLTFVQPQATKGPDEVRQIIAQQYGIEVLPFHLSHRTIFADAPAHGKTPVEMEPNGKAAAELERLYLWVSGVVGLPTSGLVELTEGGRDEQSGSITKRA